MKRVLFLMILFSYTLDASDAWIQENIYKKQEEAEKRAKDESWFSSDQNPVDSCV